MRHVPQRFTMLATVTALALSLSITAQSHDASTPTSTMPSTMHPASGAGMGMGMNKGGGSEQMHKSMMSGMDSMKMMTLTGDTDMDFAMMMKIHHEQALEMAKAEIAHGKSAELKAMSRKIIAAQQKEITQLEKWIAAHK